LRCADTHSYCYINCNSHSDSATTYTNSDSASTDTYANCNNDTTSYGDTNSYTHTGYSLSTIDDDRSYQGSQHAVEFHSTSKRD